MNGDSHEKSGDTVSKLRISWTVNVPILAGIAMQLAAGAGVVFTWKASIEQQMALLESRVGVVEKIQSNNSAMSERIKGVEVKVEVLTSQGTRIENKLDRVIEGRR